MAGSAYVAKYSEIELEGYGEGISGVAMGICCIPPGMKPGFSSSGLVGK